MPKGSEQVRLQSNGSQDCSLGSREELTVLPGRDSREMVATFWLVIFWVVVREKWIVADALNSSRRLCSVSVIIIVWYLQMLGYLLCILDVLGAHGIVSLIVVDSIITLLVYKDLMSELQ